MDILSRLFDEMHLHNVQYISVHATGAWQLTQPKLPYLTFIVVTSGQLYLEHDSQQHFITANNMMMLTSLDAYVCQSHSTVPSHAVRQRLPAHQAGQSDMIIEGYSSSDYDPTEFIIVRCQFDIDMAQPLLSALPASLPPPAQKRSIYHEVVQIGLQFFQLESGLQRPGKITMLERLASMLMIECIREYVEQLDSVLVTSAPNTQHKSSHQACVDSPWQIATTPIQSANQSQHHASEQRNASSTTSTDNSRSQDAHSGNWLAALKDPYLAKTLFLMHRYPHESWTIQRLAAESGLSRSALSDRFKQVVGITPQAYLSQYRLRLAARFLREEQYSISKISELVGYASDTSFNGAFKRRYAISPSQYRKINR